MRLHSKAPLRCASERSRSPYTRTGGFCPGANPEFQRVARQNPPVLWLTESACSRPEQPLSATHGRQRYSILDFASKVVCHETAGFIGFFLPRRALPSIGCLPPRQRVPFGILSQQGALAPIGNPEPKEFAIPLESQMRFGMRTHKEKMNCGHSFQNAPLGRSSAMVISRGFAAIR